MKKFCVATICAGTLIMAAAVANAEESPVSLRLSFAATGMDDIWAYGVDEGIFANSGINLTVNEGKGSAVTAQTVGNGSDNCGIVDAGTWLTIASKGIDAKAVLSVYAQNTLAVLSPANKPISTAADLEGKSLAITAGDGPSTLLPILMELKGVDASKVNLINMQPGPKLTSLGTGGVDGVVTNKVIAATMASKGIDTEALMYWDNGVQTPGFYMICSNSFLENKEIAGNFIGAAQKTLRAVLDNPEKTAESFSKKYTDYNKELALAELKLVIGAMPSADKSLAVGWISEATLATGLDILTGVGQIENPKTFDDYATNEFLDPALKPH